MATLRPSPCLIAMRVYLLLLLSAPCGADTVTMHDGTFLRGQIIRIAEGVLEMQVPSLGSSVPHRLPLTAVESFHTEEAVIVSAGGVVQRGQAAAAAGRVNSTGGTESSPLNRSLELWRDPSLRPAETAGQRQWTAQIEADLSGRNGVLQGSGYSVGAVAKGVTPGDTVTLSTRLMRASAGAQTSVDDLHVTAAYETNPTARLFAYVRSDSGFDHARQIDFFSINAGGWGFRLHTDAQGKLDARLGFAHRYEKYGSPAAPSLATPSADLGLMLVRELGWAGLDVSLGIVPSLRDPEDYFLRHETSLHILRNAGPLSLRLGVANDFRSKPLPSQVKTETSYFLRTTYDWK